MRRTNRFLSSLAIAAVAAGGFAGGGLAQTASAGVAQSSVVSQTPAAWTPNLVSDSTQKNPAAYALEQSGGTMYVGGQFHEVAKGATKYVRDNFVAFSATNGAISSISPAFNGRVWAIRASGGSLYVAGAFTTVNGIAKRGLVKLDATTGAVDTGFTPPWRAGIGYDLQVVAGRVIVGGTFNGNLLALNPTTGANTHYLSLGISGAEPYGSKEVYRFAVSNDHTRLVAIGDFLTVAGQNRARAFMVDLNTASGTLDPWYYQPLEHPCLAAKTFPGYLRDVDFAPDSSYFVIAATGYVPDPATVGGGVGVDICDAAAKFQTAHNAATGDAPDWINYTGGDTLHSVVVTGAAVYVQGHQRWLDNPGGKDSCGPNNAGPCSPRPGIGAINPQTGMALPWNPTKTRAVGGRDLLATSAGLWVASDGRYIGTPATFHYGIAFLPL